MTKQFIIKLFGAILIIIGVLLILFFLIGSDVAFLGMALVVFGLGMMIYKDVLNNPKAPENIIKIIIFVLVVVVFSIYLLFPPRYISQRNFSHDIVELGGQNSWSIDRYLYISTKFQCDLVNGVWETRSGAWQKELGCWVKK